MKNTNESFFKKNPLDMFFGSMKRLGIRLKKTRESKDKGGNRKICVILLLLVLIIAAAEMTSVTASRYVMMHEGSGTLAAAKEFHFESDYLKPVEISQTLCITDFDRNSDSLFFELYNYADSLRYMTEDAITYTVEILASDVSNPSCNISIKDKNGIVISTTPRATISPGDLEKHTVTISGLQSYFSTEQSQVTVIIASQSPYYKVLKAVYTSVPLEANIEYTVVDNGGFYVEMHSEGAGIVNIAVPPRLVPDKANPVLQSYDAGTNRCTVAADIGVGYTLLFFRTNSNDVKTYTEDDFAIFSP